MKSLVTGANGFIGSHLIKALEDRGEVIKLPREYLSSIGKLETFIGINKPDYIFHLAAYGNMSNQKFDGVMVEVNLLGTYNLLVASRNIPYKALINVSSSSVLLPHQTMYSATKLGAEALCKAFVDEYNKPIVSVRPFSVYGPNEASFRFIPTVFRSCLDGEPMTLDPEAVHDWVFIKDIVMYMIATQVNIELAKGRSIELGTGIETTNKEVVKLIEEITGKKANITLNERLRSFDNSKWVTSDSPVQLKNTPLKQGLQLIYDDILKTRKEDKS